MIAKRVSSVPRDHDERGCPAAQKKCYKCNAIGHFAPMCKAKAVNGIQAD